MFLKKANYIFLRTLKKLWTFLFLLPKDVLFHIRSSAINQKPGLYIHSNNQRLNKLILKNNFSIQRNEKILPI